MATNSKISDLNPVKTPLQTGDLLAVVQTENGNSETRRATFGNLLGSIVLPGSTTRLIYPDSGETAVEATTTQINVLNKAGAPYMVFNPTDSTFSLTAGKCALTFDSDGFAFNRQEVDANGVASEAWQIRLNSDDTYLTSNNDVEIVGGAKSTSAKKLTLENLDLGGRVRLLSGGKMSFYCNDSLDINSYDWINMKSITITDDKTVPNTLSTGTVDGTKRTIHGYQKSLCLKDDSYGLELATKSVVRTIITKANGDQDIDDVDDTSDTQNRLVFVDDRIELYTNEIKFHVANQIRLNVGNENIYIGSGDMKTIRKVLNTYSSIFQSASVIITSDLSNCTISGNTLTANSTGAFNYNGNSIGETALIFFNLPTTSTQSALNGICQFQTVGSGSEPWVMTKYIAPYIVEVSATDNPSQSGIYIKTTGSNDTNVFYKKM
jgi:hypothetical protein